MNYQKYPFVARPTPNKHPDFNRLRVELAGFETGPWNSLLEIGCGQGSYLISLAWFNPSKTFIGIDSDQAAIETASTVAKDLGLSNVKFKAVELEHFEVSEKFDVVLAYGVYSWIPTYSREKLLEVTSDALGETGFAIFNHNLYPGWKSRSELAETLRKSCQTPNEAREKLSEIGESSVHGLKLAEEARNVITEASDSFIFHELLNPDADCCSSSEFTKLTSAHDLETLDPVIDLGLKGIPSTHRINERSIRNIVLLKNKKPAKSPTSMLEAGWFTSKFVPAEESAEPTLFYSPIGEEIRFEKSVAAALSLLSNSWPASIPYSELAKVSDSKTIQSLLAGEAIEFFSAELPVSKQLKKPFCCPLSTHQDVFPGVSVNCRFEFVKLNEPMLEFLKLCNGLNSLSEIRELSGMSETECLDAIQIFQEMALLVHLE